MRGRFRTRSQAAVVSAGRMRPVVSRIGWLSSGRYLTLLALWLLSGPGVGCNPRAEHPRAGGTIPDDRPSPQTAQLPGAAVSLDARPTAVSFAKAAGPRRVATGVRDWRGESVALNCQACHAVRRPDLSNKSSADLNEFHQGLSMNHGGLTCVSCHQADAGYASLRLADGQPVDFADSMQLCAQCHGPQFRDYQHGVHGGMTGYWDLSRGERQRNHCTDCHDPHAPQYPVFWPAPGPRDRLAPVAISHGEETNE